MLNVIKIMLQCKKEEEKNQNIDFYKILIFFFFLPPFFYFYYECLNAHWSEKVNVLERQTCLHLSGPFL